MSWSYKLTSGCSYSVSETDQLLAHIQSFGAAHAQVPDCLKQGLALFTLQTHGRKARARVQLNVKDGCSDVFVSFWKPLLLLDMHVW